RVRADQVRDEGGQPVVVAEPDLLGGHRVVLVDHRHDAEREQPGQGALGVAVVRAANYVVRGEQDLANGEAVPRERRDVGVAEGELADAGRGLLGGQVRGTARDTQRGEAGRDRTGGD